MSEGEVKRAPCNVGVYATITYLAVHTICPHNPEWEAFQAGILKSGTVRAPITGFLSSRS